MTRNEIVWSGVIALFVLIATLVITCKQELVHANVLQKEQEEIVEIKAFILADVRRINDSILFYNNTFIPLRSDTIKRLLISVSEVNGKLKKAKEHGQNTERLIREAERDMKAVEDKILEASTKIKANLLRNEAEIKTVIDSSIRVIAQKNKELENCEDGHK